MRNVFADNNGRHPLCISPLLRGRRRGGLYFFVAIVLAAVVAAATTVSAQVDKVMADAEGIT
jgi:hypothetical protein